MIEHDLPAHALPAKHVGHGQMGLTGLQRKTWDEICAFRGATVAQIPTIFTQVIAYMQLQLVHASVHATITHADAESVWKANHLSAWLRRSRVEGNTPGAKSWAVYIEDRALR